MPNTGAASVAYGSVVRSRQARRHIALWIRGRLVAINTRKVRDSISERIKAQGGTPADAIAEDREVKAPEPGEKASEKTHSFEAVEAWLRMEEWKLKLTMRRRLFYWHMSITSLECAAAVAAVFLNGFGLTAIPGNVILALLVMTVAQVAAMFPTVVRYLFPTR